MVGTRILIFPQVVVRKERRTNALLSIGSSCTTTPSNSKTNSESLMNTLTLIYPFQALADVLHPQSDGVRRPFALLGMSPPTLGEVRPAL